MGASVQISRRLCAIADMVTEGNRLVDVGCDHGYLPVYLKLQGRIPGAIATDVAEGPLSRARAHIDQYGLYRTWRGRYFGYRGNGRTFDGAHSRGWQKCLGRFSGDDPSATVGYSAFSTFPS